MKRDLRMIILIVTITLIGYYQLSLGASFFVEEDPLTVFGHTHGNAMGNGWRPDKGFGISSFFNDPGNAHAWSVFTLWEWITRAPVFAYNSSVLILLILSAVAQYFFLKKISGNIGGLKAGLLAPLIIFGPLQHEFFFQRHWITLSIGTPLFIMLLYDYYSSRKTAHLFKGALLLWFVLFFGSFCSYVQLLIVGMVFSFFYAVFHKVTFREMAARAAKMYSFILFWTVLLGFWVFYPILIECLNIKYIRDPVYITTGLLNLKGLINYFIGLFHSGWLADSAMLVGMERLPTISWVNCSVVFPLILIYFLFRKAKNFWEFSLKWTIIIFLSNELLMSCAPGYSGLINAIFKGYPLGKFQTAYHVLGIGLIAIFIAEKEFFSSSRLGRAIQRMTSFTLTFFYFLLFTFACFALLFSGVLPRLTAEMAGKICPSYIAGFPKDLLIEIATFNIAQMQKAMHWRTVFFFLLNILLVAPFLRTEWLRKVRLAPQGVIPFLLLLNGLFLSWSVYPLNIKPLIWDNPDFLRFSQNLNATDRFYKVFDEDTRTQKTLESFKKNWMGETVANKPEYLVGTWSIPAFNISSVKSFTQKNVADYIFQAFDFNSQRRISDMRSLAMGPLISSELLDMGSVNYYYSPRELSHLPSYLSLSFKMKQVYIYRNKNSWPYYYLADKVEEINDIKDLTGARKGIAYIFTGDFIGVRDIFGQGTVSLRETSYGKMIFDYYGEGNNLLVVADAWHPFWKAGTKDIQLSVLKTNGIFKAIKLPKGKHVVTLYFDTSAYRPGIIVAAAAWFIFLLLMSFKQEGRR